MSAAWEDVADTFRRRARRIVGARGIAWVAVIVVLALWTVGLIDWGLRSNDPWIRSALAVGLVATVAATVWRALIRPLRTRLSDVDVARTIERCDPRWRDRLSSAAQFRSGDRKPELGSSDLQQVVIADVDKRLATVDLQRVFETTPTKRLVWASAAVCLVGAAGALWQHAAAATALSRVAMPFAEIPWPRSTELRFLDADLRQLGAGPHRTAAGEPFPLYVENRLGALPDDVVLQLQLPDGRSEGRAVQVTVLRDDSGLSHEVGVATLTAHEGPVRFRAAGGDDLETSWRTLEVMPAPAVEQVTTTITPPAYTQQQPKTLAGAGAVEALVGSRIRFSGQANKPLASAELRREGQPPQEMELSADAKEFAVEFTVEAPGHSWFWFDLADAFGLEPSNPPRYELRGISDRQPAVFIDDPAGDVTVTPDAIVPLRIVARDDLGIASLNLVHSHPDGPPERLALQTAQERPTEDVVELVWSLGPLGLKAGDRLTYHAEAVDAYDLHREGESYPRREGAGFLEATDLGAGPSRPAGQIGVSARRHIDVVTRDEKAEELASRQIKILDTLEELRDRQAQALETTAGLRIQAELAGALSADDLDLLKQTELEQRAIRDQLVEPQSGAAGEIAAIQQELGRNHIDDPRLAARLTRLSQDLRTLTESLLPAVEQSLTRAKKLSPTAPEDRRSDNQDGDPDARPSLSGPHLREAERNQSAAVDVMKATTEELGNWKRRYEVLSELDDAIVDQAEVQRQTQDVGRTTLTKNWGALTAQQQADLTRLSDRQERLADRLDELIRRGTEPLPDGETPTPAVAAMQEALDQLKERRTAADMHSAAQSLKRNDLARSVQTQQQVLDDLRGFGELLYPADERATESLLKSLDEQLQQVESLKKRQSQLTESSRQTWEANLGQDQDQQLERLVKQQTELAERAETLAQQLRQRSNRRGAQSAARAARRMRQAQAGIEQRSAEQTAVSQHEALDDLQQLADELALRRRQIEQQLVRQQIEQLTDDLQAAADRQESLTLTTVSLDQRQRQRGSWSRSMKKELRETTDEQAALIDRIEQMRSSLSEFPVIDVALEQAAVPMRSAIEGMQRSDVGAQTVEHQRAAHLRLLAVVAAARPSEESADAQAAAGGQSLTPPSLGQSGLQQPRMVTTQLRLLRHLQTDVQRRTDELLKQTQSPDADSHEISEERESLARDQSRIAELTQELLKQFSDLPEEHP